MQDCNGNDIFIFFVFSDEQPPEYVRRAYNLSGKGWFRVPQHQAYHTKRQSQCQGISKSKNRAAHVRAPIMCKVSIRHHHNGKIIIVLKNDISILAEQTQSILLLDKDVLHLQVLLPLLDPEVPELLLLEHLLLDVGFQTGDFHVLFSIVDDEHLLCQMGVSGVGFGDRLAHRLVLDAGDLTGRAWVILVLEEVW